jgi:lysophospholipase L1-like esterase
MGDSITRRWVLGTSFPGKSYTDAGVERDTTTEMLARFAPDVLVPDPDAVIILGGTNDLYFDEAVTVPEGNLQTMCEDARAAGVVPILSTIMPRGGVYANVNPQVIEVNAWIKRYGQAAGVAVADYYSVLVDSDGELPPSLTADGIHPSAAGYALMAPVAAAAIARAQ